LDKICVIGAGGHGREIIQILKDINRIKKEYEILGFIDDNYKLLSKQFNGYPVVGGIRESVEKYGTNIKYVLGIGDPQTKKRITEELAPNNLDWPIIIHPSVRLTEHITLEQGVVIFPGCVISVNVKLEEFVCINSLSSVSHDSIIKKFSIINPGAFINGNVVVSEGVYLGSGTTTIHNIKIGEWSVIGAGAAVVGDIPAYSTAVGVPAKVIKKHG